MSASRQRFLDDVAGIRGALALDPLSSGATAALDPPSIIVLRRGIIIASFIALETFIRQRCVELVSGLSNWAGSYDDLPAKFRDAALMGALSNLQKYAQMLKRQGDDYNGEIASEILLMSKTSGPIYSFSRHIAGDYTGNVSTSSLKDLLQAFCIKDCWNSMRSLCSEVGFGVPSVEELLKSLARKRHRSAHVSGYSPTTSDTQDLADQLICLGFCIDVAMTSSTRRAVAAWTEWRDETVDWRGHIKLALIDHDDGKWRLSSPGRSKAIKISNNRDEVISKIPSPSVGGTVVVVSRDSRKIPNSWSITT